MKKEVISQMNLKAGHIYIDATLGGGGYSFEIIDRLQNTNKKGLMSILIAIDLDTESLMNFHNLLTDSDNVHYQELDLDIKKVRYIEINLTGIKVFLVNANFADTKSIYEAFEMKYADLFSKRKVCAIVADLGLNSDQLDHKSGFSFKNLDQELDMRLDMNSEVPAWKLIEVLSSDQLAMIFRNYGDERHANKIARDIKNSKNEIRTVEDLVFAINRSVGRDYAVCNDVHSRIFQSLRIAVNTEYQNLEQFLTNGYEILDSNGKLIVITFHSGEDRIVKNFQKKIQNRGEFINPTEIEILENNRSRSAKMRTVEKKDIN